MSIADALAAQEKRIAQMAEEHAKELLDTHKGWAWVCLACLVIGFIAGKLI